MRKVVAAVLFAIAGALLLLAFLAVSSLLDEYRDSPDSLYITMAGVELAGAAVAAIGGAILLRGR